MTHTRNFSLLLAPVLLVSVAFAQTKDLRAENRADEVMAARSRYTQTAENSPATGNGAALAQLRRGRLRQPLPPRGYPRGTYQTPWMEHGNAAHAAIGAAIGFGIGATLGAINSEHRGTPVSGGVLIGGGLFGFIGGAIGAVHGGPHLFTHRRGVYGPSGPHDDEDEGDLRSDARTASHGRLVPARPAAPSQSATIKATTPSASEAVEAPYSFKRVYGTPEP